MSRLGRSYRPPATALENSATRTGRLVDGPLFGRLGRALGLSVALATEASRPATPRADDLGRRPAEVRDQAAGPPAGGAGRAVVGLGGHGVQEAWTTGRSPSPAGARSPKDSATSS